MSADSSKKRRSWGIVAAIVGGAVAFLGAQFLVVNLFSVLSISTSSSQGAFYLYGTVSLVTLMILSLILRIFKAKFSDLGFKKPKIIHFGYALVAFPVYMIISVLLASIIALFFPALDLEQAQNIGFSPGSVAGVELLFVFVTLVVLPPIVEELLFRGYIFKGFLRDMSPIFAALFTSVLFGVAHGQINVMIDTFALSLVLCYLVQKSDSLWPAIFLHAIKNFIAFFLLFVMPAEQLQQLLIEVM